MIASFLLLINVLIILASRALVRVPSMETPVYRNEISIDKMRIQRSLIAQDSKGADYTVKWFWRHNERFVVPFTTQECSTIEAIYTAHKAGTFSVTALLGLSKNYLRTRFGELSFEFELGQGDGMVIVGQPAM